MYFTRLSVSLRALRVFSRISSQCVPFLRFSALAFLYRLTYIVCRQNACVLLAFKHRFRRLTRFPSVWCHNAFISQFYLHRLRRLTRFPPYCVTMSFFFPFRHRFRRLTCFPPYWVIMRIFHTFICIVLDVLRVFIRKGS